jgi:hypothetical protein
LRNERANDFFPQDEIRINAEFDLRQTASGYNIKIRQSKAKVALANK